MLVRTVVMVISMLALTACDNFEPHEKAATYDPVTGELKLPYPCPDWSQSETHNYMNQPHSNFGCAVNTNSALQVDEPSDLYRGHGTNVPDTEVTTGVISQYRAGKLPVALAPMQDAGTGSVSQ